MHQFLVLSLDGVSAGMVYAALALALVLIWRATRIVNFAQGAMAMFTTFISLSVIEKTGSYWLGFGAALLAGLVLGAVVERVLIRRVASGPPLNAVILTLGLLLFLEAIVPMIYGGQIRSFPPALSFIGIDIGNTRIPYSPFDIFTLASGLVTMLLLYGLFRFTSVGLQMRAAAFAPEVARLLGVRVGRMLTLGWALASMAGALAGVLVAPVVLLSPNSLDPVLVFGFTAAILGGLDSPVGALAGGLGLGLSVLALEGLARLVPVRPELDDPGRRERVVDHLLEDLEREGRDMGAGERRLRHVEWVPDRGREDLGVELVDRHDIDELADDDHPVLVDVVEPADERRQERCPGLRREKSLVGREDQGAVGLDALFGEA